MKIAFLNLYGGSVVRGAETFTEALAKKLKKNHTITWYKGHSNKSPAHEFSGNLLQKLSKRLFLDQANLEVLAFTLKNLKQISEKKFDIIIPMNGFWQVLLLKIMQPFNHYKILITGHSGPGWDERFNLYLKPDLFIATTKPTLEWAEKTAPWTKSKLIPYGIDVDHFNKSKQKKLKLKEPIILCPSALVSYKRVDLAIKATANLESASLLVLGKGKLKKELESMGKKTLGNRFKLDSVSYDLMPSYYKAAAIITLPSLPQENSPMVFVESLASGKIVVTTDTNRTRWMLEGAGLSCNPENIEQYAKTLEKGLKLVKTSKINKDITKAVSKFSWKTILEKYEQTINTL